MASLKIHPSARVWVRLSRLESRERHDSRSLAGEPNYHDHIGHPSGNAGCESQSRRTLQGSSTRRPPARCSNSCDCSGWTKHDTHHEVTNLIHTSTRLCLDLGAATVPRFPLGAGGPRPRLPATRAIPAMEGGRGTAHRLVHAPSGGVAGNGCRSTGATVDQGGLGGRRLDAVQRVTRRRRRLRNSSSAPNPRFTMVTRAAGRVC